MVCLNIPTHVELPEEICMGEDTTDASHDKRIAENYVFDKSAGCLSRSG